MKFISFVLLLLFLPPFLMAENYAEYLPENIKKEKNETWINNFSHSCSNLAKNSKISPFSFYVLRDSLTGQKFPESPDRAAALFFFYAGKIDFALKTGSSVNTVRLTVRNDWKKEMEKQEKEEADNKEKTINKNEVDKNAEKSVKEKSRAPEAEIKKNKLQTKVDKIKKDKKKKKK